MKDIPASLVHGDCTVMDRENDEIVLVRERRGWMIRTIRNGKVEEIYCPMNDLATLTSVSILMGALRLRTHSGLRRHKRDGKTRSGKGFLRVE
jgi:hypothetical protein